MCTCFLFLVMRSRFSHYIVISTKKYCQYLTSKSLTELRAIISNRKTLDLCNKNKLQIRYPIYGNMPQIYIDNDKYNLLKEN